MGIERFGRPSSELRRMQPQHKKKPSDLQPVFGVRPGTEFRGKSGPELAAPLVRLTVPCYVDERSVTKKVAARLAGVGSLQEARLAVKDLAVTIDEFGPVQGFDEPVSVIGCGRLVDGPAPLDLTRKVETLPDRAPEYADPFVTELRGDETGAALQAAKAVLGGSPGWGAKIARVAFEGVLWVVLPTKPITGVVKLLTDAVQGDRPEPWLDFAQGQFVGGVCHLDPCPLVA